MPAVVGPEVGLALAALNTTANLPNHTKTWNTTYHNVVNFRKRVQETRLHLAVCAYEFLEWMDDCHYGSAEFRSYMSLFLQPPEEGAAANEQIPVTPEAVGSHNISEAAWGGQHKLVRGLVTTVEQDLRSIKNHISRIINEKQGSPEWKYYLSVHRAPAVRNLTYALFSDSSLRDEIARLKVNIGELKAASERRKKKTANATDAKLTGPDLFQLANLDHFGRKLVPELSLALPEDSVWSLELCHPDTGGNAANWQGLPLVRLWLSYSVPAMEQDIPARHRVKLEYSLTNDPNPPCWESLLPGAIPPDPPKNTLNTHAQVPGLAYNPRLIENRHGTRKLTVPFSEFFKTHAWHGDKIFLADLWAHDQAYLVLSLVNWSLLLWTSEWTTTWCSSGLRFVQAAAKVETTGKNAFFFPSFTRCAFSATATDTGQDQEHHKDCSHSDMKLRNLGVVLAEIICITPLRISTVKLAEPGQYEKHVEGKWEPVDEEAILDLVEEKTARSKAVRGAIQYCFDSTHTFETTRDKLAGFFGEYVKKVFDP